MLFKQIPISDSYISQTQLSNLSKKTASYCSNRLSISEWARESSCSSTLDEGGRELSAWMMYGFRQLEHMQKNSYIFIHIFFWLKDELGSLCLIGKSVSVGNQTNFIFGFLIKLVKSSQMSVGDFWA